MSYISEEELKKFIIGEAEMLRLSLGLSENAFAEKILGMDKSLWSKIRQGKYSDFGLSKHHKQLMDLIGIECEVKYKIIKTEEFKNRRANVKKELNEYRRLEKILKDYEYLKRLYE